MTQSNRACFDLLIGAVTGPSIHVGAFGSRSLTASMLPFAAAFISGVNPAKFAALMSTPASTISRMVSVSLPTVAACSGGLDASAALGRRPLRSET